MQTCEIGLIEYNDADYFGYKSLSVSDGGKMTAPLGRSIH
jgi:hypothetical protein